jgi:hypothetical protein
MSQTIESYLVSLGFDVKQPQLDKFNQAIGQAGKAVEHNTTGIIGNLFKMQFALTSAFVAVGAGVVAMVDKVAMADQSYRLMGLQMFMTKNAAQSMDISLKALGATIDQVAWDPELHQRFIQLQQDQKAMATSLGPDFEKNMRSIRDVRFEFSRLQVEMQYLSMSVVNDLFTKLGFGSGSFLEKLQSFNNWIIGHLPEITAAINNVLVPALKGLWEILGDIGEIGKEAWITFQQVIGALSDDDSLSGTAVSLTTVSTTLRHATEDAHEFLQVMLGLEKALAHFVLAMVDVGTGHFGAAASQLKEAVSSVAGSFKSVTPGSGAMVGALGGALVGGGGGTAAGAAIGGIAGGLLGFGVADPITIPLGTYIGGGLGGFLGGLGGGVAGTVGGSTLGRMNPFKGGSEAPIGTVNDHLSSLAAAISKNTGIPAPLIFGQLMHESGRGTNRGATDLHNFSGVKGKDGNYRDFGTDDNYVAYLSRMYSDKKYSATGLLAAKNASEYANDLKKAGYYGDSVSNYTRGIEREMGGYRDPAGGGGVTVNGPLVSIAGGSTMTPAQLTAAVQAGLRTAQRQDNVVAQANVAGVHQ